MTRGKSGDPLKLLHSALRPFPVDVALGPVNFALGLWSFGSRTPAQVAPERHRLGEWRGVPGRYRTLALSG